MIKNICFDVGNVLIDYHPEQYLLKQGIPEAKREFILTDIFRSKEWDMLDNGDISFEKAYDIMSAKGHLSKDEVMDVFDHLLDILFPIETTIELLPVLKAKGYKIYYISNFTVKYFYIIRSLYSFFDLFDNGVISGDLHQSKPGKEIFLTAFQTFGIKPGESVFIDDMPNNIATASSLGMATILLKHSEDLKQRFIEQGIL